MQRDDWLGLGCVAAGIGVYLLKTPRLPIDPEVYDCSDPVYFMNKFEECMKEKIIEQLPEELKIEFKGALSAEFALRWRLLNERYELGDYNDFLMTFRSRTRPITDLARDYKEYIYKGNIKYGEYIIHYRTFQMWGFYVAFWQTDQKGGWNNSTIYGQDSIPWRGLPASFQYKGKTIELQGDLKFRASLILQNRIVNVGLTSGAAVSKPNIGNTFQGYELATWSNMWQKLNVIHDAIFDAASYVLGQVALIDLGIKGG